MAVCMPIGQHSKGRFQHPAPALYAGVVLSPLLIELDSLCSPLWQTWNSRSAYGETRERMQCHKGASLSHNVIW
jgi:hypothetical protein